jgi:hypothetical protein
MLGPRVSTGEDNCVLCEITVSSVFTIPDEATEEIARAMASRLRPIASKV